MQQIVVCVFPFLRTHNLFFPAENSSYNTLPICMAAVHLDTAAHLALRSPPSSLSTATQSTAPLQKSLPFHREDTG